MVLFLRNNTARARTRNMRFRDMIPSFRKEKDLALKRAKRAKLEKELAAAAAKKAVKRKERIEIALKKPYHYGTTFLEVTKSDKTEGTKISDEAAQTSPKQSKSSPEPSQSSETETFEEPKGIFYVSDFFKGWPLENFKKDLDYEHLKGLCHRFLAMAKEYLIKSGFRNVLSVNGQVTVAFFNVSAQVVRILCKLGVLFTDGLLLPSANSLIKQVEDLFYNYQEEMDDMYEHMADYEETERLSVFLYITTQTANTLEKLFDVFVENMTKQKEKKCDHQEYLDEMSAQLVWSKQTMYYCLGVMNQLKEENDRLKMKIEVSLPILVQEALNEAGYGKDDKEKDKE